MSDVTAVVLTIGEPYTKRALASLERQTLRPADTIVVGPRIAPFHRALNTGASQVVTDFFIQVDADMILDDTCVEDFRACVANGVGLVVGHLRDPLRGRITGVKLFRTQCWASVPLTDSIAPDTDFERAIIQRGWTRVNAVKYCARREHWHSFGEHRPDYNPLYTFSKFRLYGARCRYRKRADKLLELFQRLRSSDHPAAQVAHIGAAHGVLWMAKGDQLQPLGRDADCAFLERVIPALVLAQRAAAPLVHGDLRQVFAGSYQLGIELGCRQAFSAFGAQVEQLRQADGLYALVGAVGLCHGLFCRADRERRVEEKLVVLQELLL